MRHHTLSHAGTPSLDSPTRSTQNMLSSSGASPLHFTHRASSLFLMMHHTLSHAGTPFLDSPTRSPQNTLSSSDALRSTLHTALFVRQRTHARFLGYATHHDPYTLTLTLYTRYT
ncbi:MAG: hypothetical protein Q4C96_09030 [Planctomycetia bacterium]|nr:hypothetical protein [Planctomycetia bacterium]